MADIPWLVLQVCMQGRPSRALPGRWAPWSGWTAWQPRMRTYRMHSPCSRGGLCLALHTIAVGALAEVLPESVVQEFDNPASGTFWKRLVSIAGMVGHSLLIQPCKYRMLASSSSGAATPATDSGATNAALHDAITTLEEHFASRSLFRRFVGAHSGRGSQALEACASPSFLNATAGIIK